MRSKRIVPCAGLFLLCFLCTLFVSCKPKEHTEIRFWHSYTGRQSLAFQSIVAEYNRTVGRQRGVEIIAYYKGSLNEISEDLNTYKVEELPNIIEVTETAAYLAYLNRRIVCAESYLGSQQIQSYVSGFMDSGRFSSADGTYIFPLQATLDMLYLNSDLFNTFKAENPEVQTEDLRYWSSLYETARRYYEWTDARTPEISYDGSAFIAIENLENYLLTVSNQYAASIVQTGNKGIQIVLNHEMLREIWNFFYGGAIRGYVSVSEDSVNNQMEGSQLVCYLASTAFSNWTPASYKDLDGNSREMTLSVKSYPNAGTARMVIPHAISGVVVVDSGDAANTEAYYFLDWICRNQNIYQFCAEGRSIPVHQTVLQDSQVLRDLQEYLSEWGRNPAIALTCVEAYTEAAFYTTYHSPGFYESDRFAAEFAESLLLAAREGRARVETYLDKGIPYEEAINYVDQNTAFENWIAHLNEIQNRY